MQINIDSSMEGLWLAPKPFGYLSQWLPRLDSPQGQMFPLRPGLNVLYGRNGAGKTQLLHAIENASRYVMSCHEGFVLKNPRINTNDGEQVEVFSLGVDEYLDFVTNAKFSDAKVSQSHGFDARKIMKDKDELVRAIVGEFLRQKRGMLTRTPSQQNTAYFIGDQASMNDPQAIQIVPMLLPTDEAPHTRAHASELHRSYSALVAKVNSEINEASGENELEVAWEIGDRRFNDWSSSWSWSPLLNLRNFGYSNDSGGWGGNCTTLLAARGTFAETPLFLPSAWEDAWVVEADYQEFKEFEDDGPNSHYFLVGREGDRVASGDSKVCEVSQKEIGLEYSSAKSLTGIRYHREALQEKYLRELQRRLNFLPNLRSPSFSKDDDAQEMDISKLGALFDEEKYTLQLTNGVLASQGSEAERRWISLAREAMSRSNQIFVIDEPESGLHRVAEAELAEVISSPSWLTGSVVVIATHSPEFLELPQAHVLHIEAGQVREVTPAVLDELDSMGIRPADLLTHVRSFLLVEGEHEKLIFNTLFSEELRLRRCKIIVARGGKYMKDVFESQMIFSFSDAKVISLLDNIEAEFVTNLWQEARKLASKGQVGQAGRYVRAGLPRSKSGENKFLSEFLSLALEGGQHERVEVWGLSKGDILYYFPSIHFGLKRPFEELVSEHKVQYVSGGDNFKTWARKKYSADFSDRGVIEAANSLDHIPDDFVNLLMFISSLSTRNASQ